MDAVSSAIRETLTEIYSAVDECQLNYARLFSRQPLGAKSATMAKISEAIRKGAKVIEVKENQEVFYEEVASAYEGMVQSLYNDSTLPMEYIRFVLRDITSHFVANKTGYFRNFMKKKNGGNLEGIAEHYAKSAPKRPFEMEKAVTEAILAHPSKAISLRSPSSDESYAAQESPTDGSADGPVMEDPLQRKRQGRGRGRGRGSVKQHPVDDGEEPRRVPASVQVIAVRRFLEEILSAPNAPAEIPLVELYQKAVDAKIFRERKRKDAQGSSHVEVPASVLRKLGRVVHKAINGFPQDIKLAVGEDSVVNVTKAQIALAPVELKTNPEFDVAFLLGIHLMQEHFRIKGTPGYAGHNICCVVLDAQNQIVGFDFNQCKYDKNLCSHAEKRLAESLNEVLKATTPSGKPPSLHQFKFVSSLEPCHMCANFVSRMGITQIGYLMGDPMQLDALALAANLLNLQIYRPSTSWGAEMEEAFKTSGVPHDEITTYLGSPAFKEHLDRICRENPLPEQANSFFQTNRKFYPGCIDQATVLAQLPHELPATAPADTERMLLNRVLSTSDILFDKLSSDDEDDDSEEDGELS